MVVTTFSDDAHARRKRKSRAERKADQARKKAEAATAKAEQERKKAEEARIAAQQAAEQAKREAEAAQRQLQAYKSGQSAAPVAPAASGAPGVATAAPNAMSALPATPLKAKWEGFFLQLDFGYSTAGGTDGPLIPDPKGAIINGGFAAWQAQGCVVPSLDQICYDRFITTNKGAGLAVNIQIGYNIKGYFSFWGDLSWHGSFGDKTDLAGTGAGAIVVGLHPLRFWRPDAPVDLRLYGGYGIYEVMYYYEKEGKAETEGKSWVGTTIPLGLMTEYKLGDVFAIGLDLRMVAASYERWIYNWDKDIVSELSPPQTTFRFEPRLSLGWHF